MNSAATKINTRMANRIDLWDIDRLVPYENNPRTHSPDQVAKIAFSIQEFGFNNPILVDGEDGIIAGHGRLMAARELGLTLVPVVVLDHLTDAQKRAYVLADNKLADLAGWDYELLTSEMEALHEDGFDLSHIGFSDDELADIVGDSDYEGGLTNEDLIPEPPDKPVSTIGDEWHLGMHRLVCGDSTDPAVIRKLMDGDQANLLFTDPPYGMSYGGGRAMRKDGQGNQARVHEEIKGDGLQGDDLIALVRDALGNALSFLQEGSATYVCLTWRTYAEFKAAFQSVGLKESACIVWDKESIGLGFQHYRPQHEFIFYSIGEWHGNRSESDVWYLGRGSTTEYVHPTQKPVELIERAVQNSSLPKGVVLDPFGGSGSTLIACERNDRQARLVELDPKYVDVIIKRWQEFTGLEATMSGTQKTFEQVSKERGE